MLNTLIMDIEGTEKKLDGVDSILTKITKILKKHWLILILCLLTYFVYWALTTDIEPDEAERNPVEKTHPRIVEEYLEVQDNGDTILVLVWSDGVVTVDSTGKYIPY